MFFGDLFKPLFIQDAFSLVNNVIVFNSRCLVNAGDVVPYQKLNLFSTLKCDNLHCNICLPFSNQLMQIHILKKKKKTHTHTKHIMGCKFKGFISLQDKNKYNQFTRVNLGRLKRC